MGYYLLDHANPNGANYYSARRRPVLACVVHITAGLQSFKTPDSSAENTARYAATTDRQVSWHSGSDSDSNFLLLPDSYVAFHCRGYNSTTIGHEISKKDITWGDEPTAWVDATLAEAAECLRPRLQKLGVPVRHATRAELDHSIATGGKPVGLVSHSDLDPTRRLDPGPDFPWDRFLKMLGGPARGEWNPGVTGHPHAMPYIEYKMEGAAVRDLQGHLNAWRKNRGLSLSPTHGKFNKWTFIALQTFQRHYGLEADGRCGKITWGKIHAITRGTALFK